MRLVIRLAAAAAVLALTGTLTACSTGDDEANLKACKKLATIQADYLVAGKNQDGAGIQAFFDAYKKLGAETPTELGTSITATYVSMMSAGETTDGSTPEADPNVVSESGVCEPLGVILPLSGN